MRLRHILPSVIAILLVLVVLAACTNQKPQAPATGKAAAPPLPSPEPKPVQAPIQPQPAQPIPAPAPQPAPASPASVSVKLVPVGKFTDDDLVTAMTLLKVELGVRPELKVTDISRVGSGKDSVIEVGTSLSTPTPVIAVINALLNRDRFEGRLGDKVLFFNNDVRFVCRIPACAGVEDMNVCPLVKGEYVCTWAFGLVIFQPAATRIQDAVKGMPTFMEGNETLVKDPVNLYLNNQLLDYVYVPAESSELITDMTISGNATGTTSKDAQQAAIAAMDRVRDRIGKKVMPVALTVQG